MKIGFIGAGCINVPKQIRSCEYQFHEAMDCLRRDWGLIYPMER